MRVRTRLSAPLLCLGIAACAKPGTGPAASPGLDVAEAAFTHGDPATALRIAEEKLAAAPRDAAALIMAADADAALGRRDEAERRLGQVLSRDPQNAAATLALGRLLLARDAAAAEAAFARVAASEPRNVAALTDLGIARDLLGRHAEAQAAYRQALDAEPQRIAARVDLGLSLALSGETQAALAILRPIAQSAEASPRVRQDLAAALALAGQQDEAAAVLSSDMGPPQAMAAIAGYRALRGPP